MTDLTTGSPVESSGVQTTELTHYTSPPWTTPGLTVESSPSEEETTSNVEEGTTSGELLEVMTTVQRLDMTSGEYQPTGSLLTEIGK